MERTLQARSPNCSSAMWSACSSAFTSWAKSCQTSFWTKWTASGSKTSRSGEGATALIRPDESLIFWICGFYSMFYLTVPISREPKCSLFLNRLQYFARGLQVYIRQLRVALQGKTGDALKTEEVKIDCRVF